MYTCHGLLKDRPLECLQAQDYTESSTYRVIVVLYDTSHGFSIFNNLMVFKVIGF